MIQLHDNGSLESNATKGDGKVDSSGNGTSGYDRGIICGNDTV